MSVYFVTGKLGSGKSIAAVGRIRDYLKQGRRVATNLDLNLDRMLSPSSKATVTRIPDKPRIEDLRSLGTGDGRAIDEYDESRFGLLVLDELASWFNARSWSDKSRADVIEWFLHARKYHWDIFFLVQDIEAVDKQLRDSLCEHLVVCRRLDRLAVPLIGGVLKLITGKMVTLPKAHVASVYYGESTSGPRVDRWWYRATDLYGAYRTGQVFVLDQMFTSAGAIDMRAPYTILSAWHLVGRYREPLDWRAVVRRIVDFPFQFIAWRMLLVAAVAGRRSLPATAEAWGIAGPNLAAMRRREKLINYGRRLRSQWGI